MFEQCALDDDTQGAHHHRRQYQCQPIINLEIFEAEPCDVGADHVERAMGKIDNSEQTKNDGKPEAEHGVERPINQSEEQLSKERL